MIRNLWKLHEGNLGLILIGRAMIGKSLIQFSVDGQGSVPSLLLNIRPDNDRGNYGNGHLLQKDLCLHSCIQCS